jgi:ATP-dependent helicase HepA
VRIEKDSGSIHRLSFDALSDPAFPLPPMRDETLLATFNRDEAVSREDVEFLSWDHPMVTGAMELVLGSEKGNSAAALWPGTNREEMLLEAVFVIECVAPPGLHVHRFLPPAPVRVVVNHRFEERTAECGRLAAGLRGVPRVSLLQNAGVKALLPKMAARCEELALESSKERVAAGLREMETALQGELDRLRELNRSARMQGKKGPEPRPAEASDDEMAYFLEERSALRKAIRAARPRLDALRLIFKS